MEKHSEKWAHFIAIGGTGMGALASILKKSGWKVTGSDHPLYPPMSDFLKAEAIEYRAFQKDNLLGRSWGFSEDYPHLAIVGNAISRGHVEAQFVEELLAQSKIERRSFAEALASFAIQDKRSLVVAGTHGKTTTTSLLAWALETAGLNPGFFIGGIPKNFGVGSKLGAGAVFASEGDEYDTAYWDKGSKFLHYKPHWALVTGIEFDHADIYPNVHDVEASFVRLAGRIREGCVLIDVSSAPRHGSVEVMRAALESVGKQFVRYGTNPHSKYQLLGIRSQPLPWNPEQMGSLLSLRVHDRTWSLYSPMAGQHNALNVLGVIAVLLESGVTWDPHLAQKWLQSFSGVKRRQDLVFESSSLMVMDDFAHHPTAIRETIAAIRQAYPKRRLAAFFEARSATSSRKVMQADFEKSFDQADAVFLSPPSKTNVPSEEKMDVEDLARALRNRLGSRPVSVASEVQNLVLSFEKLLKGQESWLALVMSNGPFGNIHQKLSELSHR